VGYKESLGRLDQSQHFLLIFTQVTNGQPYIKIDTSKANWEGEPPHTTTLPTSDLQCKAISELSSPFRSLRQHRASGPGAHQPDVHLITSNWPTLHYAVTEQYAKDYIMLYPSGIDVPSPAEGQPPVHFAVSYRQANKPNPTKRRVAPNILARIAITDCSTL